MSYMEKLTSQEKNPSRRMLENFLLTCYLVWCMYLLRKKRTTQMNEFFVALKNSIGSDVTGKKNGVPFLGYITSVRGHDVGEVMVHLAYDITTMIDTSDAGTTILGSTLMNGGDAVYTDLHVYFESV